MEKFPLKGNREIVDEGNNYITAYQSVLKKVSLVRSDKMKSFSVSVYASCFIMHFISFF